MQKTDVKKVACIGVGLMGASWALRFAMKGFDVTMYDIKEEFLNLAWERIDENLRVLKQSDVVSEDEIEVIKSRISATTDMRKAVSGAQFIQESVRENYANKKEAVRDIEEWAPTSALVASSTSGLLITEIASEAKHPERFFGAHPYNPPHLIPLVELAKGEKTADEVLERAKAFYEAAGNVPVVLQKEAPGFIANRVQMAVLREVADLVGRGVCTVEDADKAVLFGPGIRWGIIGPIAVVHLNGGKGGYDGIMNALNDSVNLWMDDMAAWKRFPEGSYAECRAGIEEELKRRSPEIGNTSDSLREYRDNMLITLLKLHNKI